VLTPWRRAGVDPVGITRTLQGASRTTASATLPRIALAPPVRPWLPTTTSSAGHSAASATRFAGGDAGPDPRLHPHSFRELRHERGQALPRRARQVVVETRNGEVQLQSDHQEDAGLHRPPVAEGADHRESLFHHPERPGRAHVHAEEDSRTGGQLAVQHQDRRPGSVEHPLRGGAQERRPHTPAPRGPHDEEAIAATVASWRMAVASPASARQWTSHSPAMPPTTPSSRACIPSA
jgi:hypothetical protein